MIALTHLNGKAFYMNAELIKFVEETPDTVITMRDGDKILVSEPARQVVAKIIAYSRTVRVMPILDGGVSEAHRETGKGAGP